jgi:hypothetical protein
MTGIIHAMDDLFDAACGYLHDLYVIRGVAFDGAADRACPTC